MRSNACRERILAALVRIDGVHEASISLIRARADVTHEHGCEQRTLVAVIISLGYGATLERDTG